jgi:hypothetical protein
MPGFGEHGDPAFEAYAEIRSAINRVSAIPTLEKRLEDLRFVVSLAQCQGESVRERWEIEQIQELLQERESGTDCRRFEVSVISAGSRDQLHQSGQRLECYAPIGLGLDSVQDSGSVGVDP